MGPNNLLIFIFVVALSMSSYAQCPSWLATRSLDLPLCPEKSGSSLVPETFPVGAVVVSDRGAREDTNFTRDVVEKVLMGAGKNTPLIILPVSDETMDRIRIRINSLSVSSQQKEKWKASLLQVPARGYTWQQDYMQAFVNPQTGQVVLREVQNYGRHDDSFSKIAEATKACGFIQGPQRTNSGLVNGNMGGNIEALPPGICLLGDDHFKDETAYTEYANQICSSNPEDRIKVPTSWLKVGHTDEIMKIVRNKNQHAPCDFSIVLASPKKGLELLRKNGQGQFLNFLSKSDSSARDLAIRRSNEYRGLRLVCRKNIEQRSRERESLEIKVQ